MSYIDERAFQSCNGLSSITLPASITDIERAAFAYCKNLKSITLPSIIVRIGYESFTNCTSLTDVYYAGSELQWSQISIGSYNTALTGTTIHFALISDSYTLTFNPNGGTYGTLPTPSRTGYAFAGWFTAAFFLKGNMKARCTGRPSIHPQHPFPRKEPRL